MSMMAAPANIPPPRPLVMDNNLSTNWKQWRKVWQRFEIATGTFKQEGLIRVATLLSVVGEDAAKVYDTFTWDDDQDEQCIDDVLRQFDRYCQPRTQVIYERYKFNNRNQAVGETISAYITDLRTIARNCAHEDITPDEIIRDRLVLGLNDDKMRERLLRITDLSLEKAIDICKAAEETSAQLQVMHGDMKNVSVVKKRQNRNQPKRTSHVNTPKPRPPTDSDSYECKYCGRRHGKRDCPAFGQICHQCNGRNYFKSCCRSKKPSVTTRKKVHVVDEHDFVVDAVEESNSNDSWIVPLLVQNVMVPMKLDTGSDVNILPLDDFNSLQHRPHLRQTQVKLTAYNGEDIPVKGQAVLAVKHRGHTQRALFVICPGKVQPILGRKMCDDMGLVKRVLAVEQKEDKILDEYQDLFKRLGCVPGEINIKLRPDAEPVVEPCRKVPFGKFKELEEELKRMEDNDVITKITEPTDWFNSLHLVYKPDGSLRVCIDPRNLNRAIRREHFHLPTREEIMAKMSNGKYFSKIDCTRGFWQLKLDEESSKLCTFNIPFGRYRYLRLPFGVSCAPEIYHRTIHQLFENIPNVDTSMDDIIIRGSTQEEHDASVRRVLDKCREAGLSLKEEKCEIGVTELKFLGEIVSKDGMKPDPQKVTAINQMTPPSNREELALFLGMIKYLARFLPDLSERSYHLRVLMKADVHFQWGPEQQRAFEDMKRIVSSEPVLQFCDPELPKKISCDASQKGLAAVLQQLHGNEWRPVAYASKSTTDCQSRYAPIEREALAVEYEEDTDMCALKDVIMSGWPKEQTNCSECVQPYWNYRDEMTVQNGLILKGTRIVIPKKMKMNILERLHTGHLGQEKCKRRARATVFWPGINKDIEEMVNQCTDCIDHRARHCPEPLIPHEVPTKARSKVGSDLFHHDNKDYLVIVDYHSNYPDVYQIPSQSSKSVITAMKESFRRFGIPDFLFSDNGPCYSSSEFEKFVEEWDFKHVTSSPMYPRSNGFSERNVRIIKDIYSKSGDKQMGLLIHRSTQLENGYTPSELNLGRRTRCNLPTHGEEDSKPNGRKVAKVKTEERQRQKYYHDRRGVRSLEPLKPGNRVRVYDSQRKWQNRATVLKHVAPRSYTVQTDRGAEIRRNRRDLRKTSENAVIHPGETLEIADTEPDDEIRDVEPEPYAMRTPDVQSPVCRRTARMHRRPDRLIENI